MAKKKKKKPLKTRRSFADYGCLNPVTRVVESKKVYKRKNKGEERKNYEENY